MWFTFEQDEEQEELEDDYMDGFEAIMGTGNMRRLRRNRDRRD